METPDIVQKGDPVLRARAHEVPLSDITSPRIRDIIEKMKRALDGQKDGVAIAAPQIGESVRIFVISGKVFDLGKEKRDAPSPDMVCINPKIIKTSKKKEWVPEGCLSVRWWYGQTHRAKQATIRAHDEDGNEFTLGGSGLLAQIFQHETDHLNGILFSDHAKNLKEASGEEKEDVENK